MLIGVQPLMTLPGVPQCTTPSSDPRNDGPVAWLTMLRFGRPEVVRRDADMAVVHADFPVPLLVVPDAERALEAGRDLIGIGAERAAAIAERDETRAEVAFARAVVDAERVVVAVGRDLQAAGVVSGSGASWNADEVLLCMTDGIHFDVVGQLVVAVQEEARAFLRRHDQVDRREVVLVARAGRGRLLT